MKHILTSAQPLYGFILLTVNPPINFIQTHLFINATTDTRYVLDVNLGLISNSLDLHAHFYRLLRCHQYRTTRTTINNRIRKAVLYLRPSLSLPTKPYQ
jgi:hypothetical protein